MRPGAFAALVIAATACGARTPLLVETFGDGGAIAPSPDAGTLDGVRGTSATHHFADDGEHVVPDDLSSSAVNVFVDHGDGTFDTFAGSGHADGTFFIPNVPIGQYILSIDATLIASAARDLVLSSTAYGRADAVASPNATIDLELENVGALTSEDFGNGAILLFSTNSCGVRLPPLRWAPLPALGATAVDETVATPTPQSCAIDAARGDRTKAYQLSVRTFGPSSVESTLTRVLDLGAFTMNVSGATTVRGTLTSLRLDATAGFAWKSAGFIAAFRDVGICPSPDALRLYYFLGARHAPGTLALPLVEHNALAAAPPPDDGTILMPYANAVPTWPQEIYISVACDLPSTAPHGTGQMFIEHRGAAIGFDVTKPVVTPPRAIAVGGNAPFVVANGVGVTPTIHWSPPSVSPPDAAIRYSIDISDVTDPNAPFGVLTMWTEATRFTVPPGFLSSGHPYVASITAMVVRNVDLATHPLDGAMDDDANASSAAFRP